MSWRASSISSMRRSPVNAKRTVFPANPANGNKLTSAARRMSRRISLGWPRRRLLLKNQLPCTTAAGIHAGHHGDVGALPVTLGAELIDQGGAIFGEGDHPRDG